MTLEIVKLGLHYLAALLTGKKMNLETYTSGNKRPG